MSPDDDVRAILTDHRAWAVVGCSPNPARPSHSVARFLKRHGYRVIPVNPRAREIDGERCYPRLADIPPAPPACAW